MFKGTNNLLQERRFIKEKFAKIFVDILKREWPQNWNAFYDLNQVTGKDLKLRELSLIIYKTFAEEVFVFGDDLSKDRKHQIEERLNKTDALKCLAFINEVSYPNPYIHF